MANTSSFNVISLDPITLKNSFKNFLKGQVVFQDYDFDGSNMAVLIDLMTRNSFVNAFYLNMVASEMFLDSAQMRDSVVSHAKELNYTPRSNLSAAANVNLIITTSDNSSLVTIPAYTSFTGRIGSNTFTFTTNTAITAISSNNVVIANNVTLYEGALVSDEYVVNLSANSNQRFVLNNPGVDTSSLFVTVMTNGGANLVQYSHAASLFDLNANSTVYFLQATTNGRYELLFGDDISGMQPADGSIVSVLYRISNGSLPNNISKFAPDSSINGQSNVAVIVNQPSSGGSFAESTSSIKFNAPRHFNTQERAVTEEDYETLLRINFPEIIAVAAVGGEKLSPPQYGSVQVSVAIDQVDGLPDAKRQQYLNFLSNRSTLSITPFIISPEYLYLEINSSVNYNINLTSAETDTIRTLVFNNILAYNSTILNNFKVNFRYSQLIRVIDGADNSIISNQTDVRMYKKIVPTLGLPTNYQVDYGQALLDVITTTDTILESNIFTYNGQNCKLFDDGQGNVILYALTTNNTLRLGVVGTVDYANGKVQLFQLQIDSIDVLGLKLYAIAKSKDLTVGGNSIMKINPEDIFITINQLSE